MRACEAGVYAEAIVAKKLLSEKERLERSIGVKGRRYKRVHEESITTTILDGLHENYSDVVECMPFERPAEALTGSDWVWRIKSPLGTFDMLVQAKRPKDSLGADDNSIPIDLPQRSNLMMAAGKLRLQPMYSFYFLGNVTNDCDDRVKAWSDRENKDGIKYGKNVGAIYLVPAEDVNKDSIPLEEANLLGISLSEFLCCYLKGIEFDDVSAKINDWRRQEEADAREGETFDELVDRVIDYNKTLADEKKQSVKKNKPIKGVLQISLRG